MTIYVVQPGDTLYTIARQHDVPVQRIVSDNGLHEPSRLTPGQVLVIQYPKQVYTVQQGDTLGNIASRFGMTVYELWQNNPQLGGNDRIFPGQQLVLAYNGVKRGTLAVNGYAYPHIDLFFPLVHSQMAASLTLMTQTFQKQHGNLALSR